MGTRLDRLKDYLRQSCGGSQAELAKRVHVTGGRISQIISGEDEFTERVARKWAVALHKPPDFFEQDQVAMLSAAALEIARAFDDQEKTEQQARVILEQCLTAIASRGRAFTRPATDAGESRSDGAAVPKPRQGQHR